MKVIKGFLLTLIVFLFILVLIFTQLSFAFNTTFLSSKYFNSSYEKNNISTTIKDIIVSKIEDSKINGADLRDEPLSDFEKGNLESIDVGSIILKYLDQDWLESQSTAVVKGTFSYIVSDSEKLPVINIKPAKEALLEGVTMEVMKREDTRKNLEVISQVIKILDNKFMSAILENEISNDIINYVLNLDIVKESSLDQDMIRAILKVYRENNLNETDDISELLVTEMFTSKFDLESYKDDLDLNLLFEEVFQTQENPIREVRILIYSLRGIMTKTFLILLLLLILIVCVTSFRIDSSLKWISNGLIIGGLSSVLIGLLKFVPMISKVLFYNSFYKIDSLQSIESINNIQPWLGSFINRFFTSLIIEGIILIILAIAILIVIKILQKNSNEGYEDSADALTNNSGSVAAKQVPKRNTIIIVSIRIVVFIALIILIPFTALSGFKGLSSSINEFSSSLDQSTVTREDLDMIKVIESVLKK